MDGGSAQDSRPQSVPVIAARGEHGPLKLAADDDNLYWGTTENGSAAVIRTMSQSGGMVRTVLEMPRTLDLPGGINYVARIVAIDVDADWIFASQTEEQRIPNRDDVATVHTVTGLYRAPKAGGAAELFVVPEGFVRLRVPFSTADDSIYFGAATAAGIDIAAVPKSGGAASIVHIAVEGNFIAASPVLRDGGSWYLEHSSYFGAPHTWCISRAPEEGGVLEDIWCPDFALDLLVPCGQLLAGVGPWQTAAQGVWVLDLATASATRISGTEMQTSGLTADASRGALYTTESSFGSDVPRVPATSDLIRIDLGSGKRSLIDHAEGLSPADRSVAVGTEAIFFTRDGDVLRFDP